MKIVAALAILTVFAPAAFAQQKPKKVVSEYCTPAKLQACSDFCKANTYARGCDAECARRQSECAATGTTTPRFTR